MASIPPLAVSPDGTGRAWRMEPHGFFHVVTGTHMSAELARWLVEDATPRLLKLVPAAARILFIHDWRRVRTYDLAARTRLLGWGFGLGAARVSTIHAVIEPDAPALVRMATQAGAMTYTLGGIPMTVEHDLEAALARHGARLVPGPR